MPSFLLSDVFRAPYRLSPYCPGSTVRSRPRADLFLLGGAMKVSITGSFFCMEATSFFPQQKKENSSTTFLRKLNLCRVCMNFLLQANGSIAEPHNSTSVDSFEEVEPEMGTRCLPVCWFTARDSVSLHMHVLRLSLLVNLRS